MCKDKTDKNERKKANFVKCVKNCWSITKNNHLKSESGKTAGIFHIFKPFYICIGGICFILFDSYRLNACQTKKIMYANGRNSSIS